MPETHILAWQKHFQEFPPGDFYLQILIAQLIMMVESALGGKGQKPRAMKDIAPWLDTPSIRSKRAADQRATHLRAVRSLMDEDQ